MDKWIAKRSRRHQGAARRFARQSQFETLERWELMAADFLQASLVDASGDVTEKTVFEDGALRLGYELKVSGRDAITSVGVLATNSRGTFELDSTSGLVPIGGLHATAENVLVDLKDYPKLGPGAYEMQIVARLASGVDLYSESFDMRILDTSQVDGTYQGEWLNLASELAGEYRGVVVHGQGGTDTMYLDKAIAHIDSINGQSLERFDAMATDGLPIHQGYAVDHIVLDNGNEIYFTGIESIEGKPTSRFMSNTVVDLGVAPNDPEFQDQWNLHVQDVPSAWRFTTGSEDVLLVSLDTGVLPESTPEAVYGHLADLSEDRLVTDPTDDENLHFLDYKYGHGHMSISVMSSTPNNNEFVAGINWTSDVFVADVYDGSVTLQDALLEALAYAEQTGQKVVFQGGIQGESWLNNGGSQAELEAILAASESTALYAVAAGNGGVEVDQIPASGDDPKLSGGVARLQGTHNNVIAVGAMQRTPETVAGMANASEVRRADYSNYGHGVTLMGATDSLAAYPFTGIENPQFGQSNATKSFGGTSAANPNIAGIASLTWSMNVGLAGADIRDILTDTAMTDLPEFEPNIFTGKDFDYGHGLANADLAVRRAFALAVDQALVEIDEHPLTKLGRLAYSPAPRKVDYFDAVSNLGWVSTWGNSGASAPISRTPTLLDADVPVDMFDLGDAEATPKLAVQDATKLAPETQTRQATDPRLAETAREAVAVDSVFADFGAKVRG